MKKHNKFQEPLSKYLLGIGAKAFKAVDCFSEQWDERHIMKLVLILVENPSLAIEEVIKKLKIADTALTGKKWFTDKEQGKLLLTQDEKDFNKKVKRD